MFVSADGLSCSGMCSSGRVVVAGPPGDETCETCDIDYFATSGVCERCAVTRDLSLFSFLCFVYTILPQHAPTCLNHLSYFVLHVPQSHKEPQP